MKERILTNWTFTRTIYFLIGIAVIVQSVVSQQWFGVVLGGYFALMGLFAFGCASGSCLGENCAVKPQEKSIGTSQDEDFEEVKSK